MNIGGVEIGSGFPCRTIAEVSCNHNGDLDTALALIGAAKEAGADFVKIQTYLPEELVALRGNGPAPEPWGSQGYTMATLYEQAKTPLEWVPRLFQEARRFGIPMFSSVFGAKSLAALEAVGCPAYKISHFERKEPLGAVHSCGKPVIVSSPERWWLGDSWREETQRFVLYCPGGYPAALEDMKLDRLNSTWLGLSSHCLDPLVAPIAVARGAKLLEYHFQLSWRPSTLEANVSLTEITFAAMVQSVRQAEVLLG